MRRQNGCPLDPLFTPLPSIARMFQGVKTMLSSTSTVTSTRAAARASTSTVLYLLQSCCPPALACWHHPLFIFRPSQKVSGWESLDPKLGSPCWRG